MPNENSMHRKIDLKWFLTAIGIFLAVGIGLWMWQSSERTRIINQCDTDIQVSSTQSAETIAQTIATFGNRQIVASNWEALQGYADDVVSAKSVAYIAIIDLKGVAVVHTNRSFRGSKLEEPKRNEAVVHASVPVMNLTKQVATVRVGVNTNLRKR